MNRKTPTWYKKVKFGAIIHWGLYSVPAYHDFEHTHRKNDANGSEWYWWRLVRSNTGSFGFGTSTKEYHEEKYGKDFEYEKFKHMFLVERFDAETWARLLKRCGVEYVIITTKHHDGYLMWDWEDPYRKNYNAVNSGPKRNVVAELEKAIRKEGMYFGVYYSLYEWFHPLFKSAGKKRVEYVTEIVHPQVKDLVEKYKPDIVWFDGDWSCTPEYWRIDELTEWIYNQPNGDKTVINDRQGKGTSGAKGEGRRGDVYTYNDRWGPKSRGFDRNRALKETWESVQTIGRSWGYNSYQKSEHYRRFPEILKSARETIENGGKFLLNLGPRADGSFHHMELATFYLLGKNINKL